MPQQRKMLGLATASQRLLHMGRELQHPKMKGIRCPSTCRPRSDHAAFQERRRTADGHFWLDERRRPDCHKVKSLKRVRGTREGQGERTAQGSFHGFLHDALGSGVCNLQLAMRQVVQDGCSTLLIMFRAAQPRGPAFRIWEAQHQAPPVSRAPAAPAQSQAIKGSRALVH